MKNELEMIMLYKGNLKYLIDSLPLVKNEIDEVIVNLEQTKAKLL